MLTRGGWTSIDFERSLRRFPESTEWSNERVSDLVRGIQCPRVSHGAFAECLTEVLMQQALRKRGREGNTAWAVINLKIVRRTGGSWFEIFLHCTSIFGQMGFQSFSTELMSWAALINLSLFSYFVPQIINFSSREWYEKLNSGKDRKKYWGRLSTRKKVTNRHFKYFSYETKFRLVNVFFFTKYKNLKKTR